MVNAIVSLMQMLNSAFVRDNNSVAINKRQLSAEDHINNIQVLTITPIEENDDD
jgi:hypothetical protein